MTLYYIWDAYCGWCHGFGKVLDAFVDQHPELELVVLSGGLFDAGKTIGDYPHIPSANRQISQIYGVSFEPAYEAVLTDGSLVLNSIHPAAGYAVLRNMVPNRDWTKLAKTLQEVFFHQGLSLSDLAAYREVAKQFGLDPEVAAGQIGTAWATGSHLEDIAQARRLGVSGFPTILLEKDGNLYDLRRGVSTLTELEANYRRLMEQV